MIKYTSKTFDKNTKNQYTTWYKVLENGKEIIHREGGLPAIERAGGFKEWYVSGNRHRDDGLPAVEYADGYKGWWVSGNRHRDDGLPAVVYADGYKEWWVNDKRHRDGGLPAVEWSNGSKTWWANGKLDFSRGFPIFYNIYRETDKHDSTIENSNDFCDRIINRYLQENSLKPGCLVVVPKGSNYIELNSKEPDILYTNEEYIGVFIEKFNVGLNVLFNNKLCPVRYNDVKRFNVV